MRRVSDEDVAVSTLLRRLRQDGASDEEAVRSLRDHAGVLDTTIRRLAGLPPSLHRWRALAWLNAAATGDDVGEPPAVLVEQDRRTRDLAALPAAAGFAVLRSYIPGLDDLADEIRVGGPIVSAPPLGRVGRFVSRRSSGDEATSLQRMATMRALNTRVLELVAGNDRFERHEAYRVGMRHLCDLAGIEFPPAGR